MPKQIVISDAELGGFSPQAAIDLEISVSGYKTDLLKEIGRLEAGMNTGSGAPEITSRMVKEAEVLFSRGSIFNRRKRGSSVLKFLSVVFLFISGAMVQKEYLKDFTYLVVFLVVLSFTILINALVHLRD